MLAVHLENGAVSLREVPIPERKPGFALIRTLCAGICNTDLELQRGYYGFAGTPGHEFVGEVVEAETPALIGKRVVGEINLGCDRAACSWCAAGMSRHCPERTVLGIVRHPGAFAEFLTLPERNLHQVPASLPDEAAVFTEPVAAAYRILDQCRFEPGDTVAVLGDGKLGLLIAQVLHSSSVTVHHYGRHAEKLRISERRGILTRTSATGQTRAYPWVVEATGSASGLDQAIQMTRPLGSIILKSTVHGLAEVNTASVVVNEITLIGSRCGRFEPALALLRTCAIDPRVLITEVLPLKEAARAFEIAASPGMLKVLLR